MPRPKKYRKLLERELPRVRVSKMMYEAVQTAADEYGLSVSDLVRACIAHVLDWPNENSELIVRMVRDKVSSLKPQEGEDEEA